MIDTLLLLSGNDIPFAEAQLIVRQPRLREIAYLGEENFFMGYELLNFSKNLLPEEDKINLEKQTNFDILIAILREQNAVMQKNKDCLMMVLAILFPEYSISISESEILLEKDNEKHSINNTNFEVFKDILNNIFNFKSDSKDSEELNPEGEMARRIAEKLKNRHKKLAEQKSDKKLDILSRYISILSIGLQKDMNELFNYTVFQLMDEFKRFQLKIAYDLYVEAKMAGAKDLKEVEEWMKNIHS